MLERNKADLYRWIIYTALIICIPITAYIEYLRWLNPLNLKVEEDPKQHDGSQEFNPPRPWESAIQPAPDDDGVRRYLDPWELWQHGKEPEPESEEVSPEEPKDIVAVPKIGPAP